MKLIYALIAAAILTGCVTAPSTPAKRPLKAEVIQSIGRTKVAVNESSNGVEKSWFMTDSSAAGAQYGLLGGLVSGVMDAIMNAGPSRRAQKAADEVAEYVSSDELTVSMVQNFQSASTLDAAAPGVSFAEVVTVQRILKPDGVDDAVELTTTYTLSEDASAFRCLAIARYNSPNLKYQTPYKFKGSVPKSELSGPIYTNTFTYHSAQLPVPSLTPELREKLIDSIKTSYKNENGVLPAADSTDGKAMAKELESAQDSKLTKDEIAIFLTREWMASQGALLKQEIEKAHGFIAKYLLKDLNDSTVPSFTGTDELLETLEDGRTVRRIGSGVPSGSYVSSSGNLTQFTTYGNTTSIAKKQSEKIKKLSADARSAKAKS